MNRRKKSKIILGLLIAVVALGVGYAAITGLNLLISGTSSVKQNGDFIVRFVKPESTETAMDNAEQNAIKISGKNADDSDMDVSNMSATIEDDTHATFNAGELDEVGEYAEFTYNVVNESEGINANLSFEVSTDDNDYFDISKTVSKDRISEGEISTVKVKVELIATPKVNSATENLSVTLVATPQEESEESGGGGNEPQKLGPTFVAPSNSDTHKGTVYINPTDATETCNSSNSQIGLEVSNSSGCLKFYVFDDSGNNYKLILDHNTTALVAWNSDEENSNSMMKEVMTTLENDTSGWIGSPRLITADEVAAAIDSTAWKSNEATQTGGIYFGSRGSANYSNQSEEHKARQRSYHWLFDYTNSCTSYGCITSDNSTKGYWTSTPLANDDYYVWMVHRTGYLGNSDATNDDLFGVRPVIEISKSLVK